MSDVALLLKVANEAGEALYGLGARGGSGHAVDDVLHHVGRYVGKPLLGKRLKAHEDAGIASESGWAYLTLPAEEELVAGFAEKGGELVVETELALREYGLGLLTRLGERYDWIAADGDTSTFGSDRQHEGFGAALADAHAEAGNGAVSVEFLAALRMR
jgi:hypothetical protein